MVHWGNYDDKNPLMIDMGKYVDACIDDVFEENPNADFLLIEHNLSKDSEGLEHINSTPLQVNHKLFSLE